VADGDAGKSGQCTVVAVSLPTSLRVLSWNLFHGRAVPGAGRDLLDDFTDALSEWEWDVALLQEVPPWWPARLAARLGAQERHVLTSRNSLPALRRALATRWPDLIKSHGGGANAILVRDAAGGGSPVIAEHRTLRLALLPERRWMHAVRLADGSWIGNLHATAHHDSRASRESARAAEVLRRWAGGAPAVLGGDFNQRSLELDGMASVGGHDVDHVFASGLRADSPLAVLEHGCLSDHAPLRASLTAQPVSRS
jgi:endonuclease/exonuclease/phosphatase family metal-dependent hydrolase